MTEGLLLAIESSAARASVALGRTEGQAVFGREVEVGRRQSEVLMEPLREALAVVENENEELGLVIVGTGPGSYNGARVGIAAGQGVSLVFNCPTIGLSSLEAVAPVRAGGPCLALGDARRGMFFTLEICNGELSGMPDLLSHVDFVRRVAARAEAVELVTLEDPTRLKLPAELAAKVSLAAPRAAFLLEAWQTKSAAERARLVEIAPQPYYLRPPHITKPVP